MYLPVDFDNYLPNFLSRNRLYNIYLKFQYIGIKGVIFKASKRTGFFQFYEVGAGKLEEIFAKFFLVL